MNTQENSNRIINPATSATGNNVPATNPPEAADISKFAARVQVPKLQGYAITNIQAWFTRLEAFFSINSFGGMSQDQQDQIKFNITLMHMDEKLHEQAYEIVRNPPQVNRYELLKQTIISKFSASPMARLEQLTTGIQLGDSKPSHILTQLQRTEVTKDTQLIRNLWLQRLPVSVRAVIACVARSNPACSMDELGAIADEILDSVRVNSLESISSTKQTTVSIDAVSNDVSTRLSRIEQTLSRLQKEIKRSPSPRRRTEGNNSICFYHEKFGSRARKCNQPCQFTVSKN